MKLKVKEQKKKKSEKIKIEAFDNKLALSEKDKDISPNLKKAVVTHYLHNMNNGAAKHFEKEAKKYIKQYADLNLPEYNLPMFEENALQQLLFEANDVPFPNPKNYKFKFIDLFAGIGGFRMAMRNLKGKCVFTSEWDKEAQKTYRANFGDVPFGDITKEETKKFIPDDFDILCAGFPCQAFSIAGKRRGFDDIRGTLFYDVAEIIRRKQPKAFFLENVKGLINHDKGNTLKTILFILREKLGYYVPDPKIVNAKDFGVPQNRERIFIVGFHKNTGVTHFEYPEPSEIKVTFKDVKEKKSVDAKYYLSKQYLETLVNHKARHAGKGNGFGYEIISEKDIANAVVCGGMGRERNLIIDKRLKNFTPTTPKKGGINKDFVRTMTPREWARLQGFKDEFVIPVSDASAYKQFGNSVAVPAIQATAEKILKAIDKNVSKKH